MTSARSKVIHVLGVVLFLGNINVTGVWKTLADRTGDPRTIAYAQRGFRLNGWQRIGIVASVAWAIGAWVYTSASFEQQAWSDFRDS